MGSSQSIEVMQWVALELFTGANAQWKNQVENWETFSTIQTYFFVQNVGI